jgi:hypothetical protein
MQMHRENAPLFDIVEKKNATCSDLRPSGRRRRRLDQNVREAIERLRSA